MKKVRITESQLRGIVKRMIREESRSSEDDDTYEDWTYEERSYLTTRKFKPSPYNKGIALIETPDGYNGMITKFNLDGRVAKNQRILNNNKFRQFEVSSSNSIFERKSFMYLEEACAYILDSFKKKASESQKGNSNMQSLGESQLRRIC
jgi:nitrate reductase beta subunit